MAGINQYRAFGIGSGANTLSYTAYDAVPDLIAKGFQPGIAKSEEVNTVLRLVTVMTAALASLALVGTPTEDMLDNGNVVDVRTKLQNGLNALYLQDLTPFTRNADFSTGAKQSLTTNGWQELPGGLLVQWGVANIPSGGNSGTVAVSFPRTFIHDCFHVSASGSDGASPSWGVLSLVCKSKSSVGFTLFADSGNSGVSIASGRVGYWLAIGW